MKLEHLALWDEKTLFTEQGETDKGFIGWLKGSFNEDKLSLSDMLLYKETDSMLKYEIESLISFLKSESACYVLRSHSDLNSFCQDKVHDHIPYCFNRECWGFRVLNEEYAWYLAFTPWNSKSHLQIYCYDRKVLMSKLAAENGLPEYCHGVLKYTGERILIRYGDDMYDSFPQYGSNVVENRSYVNEQNKLLKLSAQQVSAMENGVIFGWDTPMADPKNYDNDGHFYVPKEEVNRRRRSLWCSKQSK